MPIKASYLLTYLLIYLLTCLPSAITSLLSHVPYVFLPHPWSSSHPPYSWLWYSSHHWHIFVHSRLDYYNSMHYCISCVSKSQLNRHQRIQDALACVVIAAPISPIHSRVSELAQDTLWYRNVLNAKLFPPHRSSSSLFPMSPEQSHHSTAFSIHSIIYIGHSPPNSISCQS